MDEKPRLKFFSAPLPHNSPPKLKKYGFRNNFGRLRAITCISSLLFAGEAVAAANNSRHFSVPPAAPPAEQPQQAPLALPDAAPLQFNGGTFSIQNLENGPSLVFEEEGHRHEAPLLLPPREAIGDPIEVRYGEKYSFMLTRNADTGDSYAVIMLGAADVAAGRTTLPNNDLINADCVLLPPGWLSESFAEDRIFFLYGESTVRVLEAGTGRLRKLTVEGLSDDAEDVAFMGIYFLLQPTSMPVMFIGKDGDSYAAEAYEYAESELRSLVRYEAADGGISAFFLNSEGETVEIGITVGEEGNLGTVHIEER